MRVFGKTIGIKLNIKPLYVAIGMWLLCLLVLYIDQFSLDALTTDTILVGMFAIMLDNRTRETRIEQFLIDKCPAFRENYNGRPIRRTLCGRFD